MFFGKYLIDKNLITHDKLLEALITQEKSQKTFLEMAVELDLIDIKLVPEIIEKALIRSISIQEYLLNENLLTIDKIHKIETAKSISGTSLGSTLVSIGALEIDKLNLALKDYLNLKKSSSNNNESSLAKDSQGLSTHEPEISQAALESLKELNLDNDSLSDLSPKSSEPEISSAALESLKELGLGGDELLSDSELSSLETNSESPDNNGLQFSGVESDYLDLFTESFFKELEDGIKELKGGLDHSQIMNLHEKITLLLGAASLEDLEVSLKLLKCSQKALENSVEENSNLVLNFLPFLSKLKESVYLLWDLRTNIIETGSEESLINDFEWKAVYFQNLKEIINLIKG